MFEDAVLLPSFLVGVELVVSRCDGVLLLLGETDGCVVVGKRENGGDGLFDKVEEGRGVVVGGEDRGDGTLLFIEI